MQIEHYTTILLDKGTQVIRNQHKNIGALKNLTCAYHSKFFPPISLLCDSYFLAWKHAVSWIASTLAYICYYGWNVFDFLFCLFISGMAKNFSLQVDSGQLEWVSAVLKKILRLSLGSVRKTAMPKDV